MAPLPPESTARTWLEYTTGRNTHEMMVRVATGLGAANALSFFSQFLAALAPVLPDTWHITSARHANAGSVLSFPVSIGGLATFEGEDTDPFPEVDEPQEWVYVGRGQTSGRRWELSVYGITVATPADYRIELGAISAPLDDALNVINSFNDVLVTIGGDAFATYSYVNVNNNSFWETKARE